MTAGRAATDDAQAVLDGAAALARTHKHAALEPIHVAHTIFHENSTGQRAVAATAVADIGAIQSGLTELLGSCTKGGADGQPFFGSCPPTSEYNALLEGAQGMATAAKGASRLSVEHLIYGVADIPQIKSVFKRAGLTNSDLRRFVPRVLSAPGSRSGSASASGASSGAARRIQNATVSTETLVAEAKVLSEYGVELVAMAREGRIDPVVCRDKEMERMIEVLSRRTKNNPCLIGEPGVGKTAIAEGLAQRIADGMIPTLAGCRIWSLDMGALVAGAKLRGEFEERMKAVLDEVIKADGGARLACPSPPTRPIYENVEARTPPRRTRLITCAAAAGTFAMAGIVIFMDEIHLALGAGRAGGGAMDAANLLKPLLARGEVRVIGATTISEFRTHVEKDPAFERRFQTVLVEGSCFPPWLLHPFYGLFPYNR